MTETAFRATFAARCQGAPAVSPDGATAGAAVAAAKAAGVVFAPEAVALSQRIDYGWSSKLGTLYLFPAGSPQTSDFEGLYQAAVACYNAYPILREALVRLVGVAGNCWPFDRAALSRALAAAEAALAQGPKP